MQHQPSFKRAWKRSAESCRVRRHCARKYHSNEWHNDSLPIQGNACTALWKGQFVYSINRLKLNELLLTRAEATYGVSVHFEHKLTCANLEEKTLVFQVGQENLQEKVVKTDFIFGCNGAYSTVQ